MRVSAKAEYACIAMLELAANYSERQPVRVKAIADTHADDPAVMRIVQFIRSGKARRLTTPRRGGERDE